MGDKTIGKNSISSKQYNRGLILQLIATGSCRTRIELSQLTKLTKMTVSNIIAEFMEHNIVIECEEEMTDGRGRNPIRLQLSEKAPKVIGLLIFRDRIEAVLCDLAMQIIRIESITFEKLTAEQLIQFSDEVIGRILRQEKNILGIGVAVIGPVDIKSGVILNPPRFYGIRNVNIMEHLQQKYPYPIYLDHDNNSAALAEKLFGIGKDEMDFIFLGISNGIGSGIISNGEIYHNRRGLAPEMGHMSIDCNGVLCSCGNRGCLEMYASSHVILDKLRTKTKKNWSYQEFFQHEGWPEIEQIRDRMVQDISVVLVSSVNMLQPEMIVLGHDCIDWQDSLVDKLEQVVNDRKLVNDHQKIRVKKAYFGKNAQLVGAAVNVVNQAFKGDLSFL